jgi:hypothetical protein
MKTDPALEAVRKARSDISRELGNDPVRLIAHYTELQAQFKGRLIHGPEGDGDENGEEHEDTTQQGNASAGRPPAPGARG